ncbi:MAG TPA: hypothetical protein VG890_03235 [Puia sp.]|nr:hypothetical protein [Puia sp.]
MEGHESLSDALRDLEEKGYGVDLGFEVETFALYGGDLDMRLNPETYHVDEIDLVEDTSKSKDEEALVYAITLTVGIKGVIVDKTGHP